MGWLSNNANDDIDRRFHEVANRDEGQAAYAAAGAALFDALSPAQRKEMAAQMTPEQKALIRVGRARRGA